MSEIVDGIISYIKENARNTYTSMPAIVTSVSKLQSSNLVSVQPAIETVLSDGTKFALPIIPDVTVQWPAGGGAVMTFPLAVGDDVLLNFSMQSIAEWEVSSGGTVEPFDKRMHNLSDAIVIPSIFRNNANPQPDPSDLEIKFNGGSFKVKSDGTIAGETTSTFSMSNSTVELVDILIQILRSINTDTVNTIYGLSPLNSAPATEVLITQLETLKE